MKKVVDNIEKGMLARDRLWARGVFFFKKKKKMAYVTH